MHIIFAKITTESSFSEQVNYMLICFLLVCFVLSIMWLGTAVIGTLFKKMDEKKSCKAQLPPPGKAPSAPAGGNADSAKVATLISSAVHATLDGAPHRIVSIRSSDGSAAVDANTAAVISAAVFAALDGAEHRIASIVRAPIDFNWAQSGRNAIYASKNPKK